MGRHCLLLSQTLLSRCSCTSVWLWRFAFYGWLHLLSKVCRKRFTLGWIIRLIRKWVPRVKSGWRITSIQRNCFGCSWCLTLIQATLLWDTVIMHIVHRYSCQIFLELWSCIICLRTWVEIDFVWSLTFVDATGLLVGLEVGLIGEVFPLLLSLGRGGSDQTISGLIDITWRGYFLTVDEGRRLTLDKAWLVEVLVIF